MGKDQSSVQWSHLRRLISFFQIWYSSWNIVRLIADNCVLIVIPFIIMKEVCTVWMAQFVFNLC